MADKILHKRSGTPSAVPSAASLELGELALNTADGRAFMKKNDGAVVEIGSNASGYFRTEPITATAAGQTSFTVPGGYTPGAIFVSLNGASLPPADFTATNGTTVVLASGSGIVAGSVLLVHVLSAFEVADALPLGGTAADSSKLGGQAPTYYATQADLAGVTPGPEFYQRSNIIGTASQSGGVPTGAIIERGSNANGEYVRYADGTQICWSPIVYSTVAVTIAAAGGFRGTQAEWTFPAEFSGVPATSHVTRSAGHLQAELRVLNATTMQPSAWCATSNGSVNCAYQAVAFGRWFN